MVSMSLSTGQIDGLEPTTRVYLNENHTPKHELAASLIDECINIYEYGGPNFEQRYKALTATWKHLLTGDEPSDDDIENLRQTLHIRRDSFNWQRTCKQFELSLEDTDRLLEYFRNQEGDIDAYLRIELQSRTEEDELRTKMLWHTRLIKSIKEYDESKHLDGLELSEAARKLLAIDFYEARGTYREYEEVHERTQEDGIDSHYTTWREILKRLPESLQRRCLPCRTYYERNSGEFLQSERKDKHGKGTECEMCNGSDSDDSERQPGEISTGESLEEGRSNLKCCKECTQCKMLKMTGDNLRPKGHHLAQVRVLIIPNSYVYPDDDIVYDTFVMRTLKDKHDNPDHETGLIPYWKTKTFYKKLIDDSRKQATRVWPLDDFQAAGIKYKLKLMYIKYEAYDEATGTIHDEYVHDPSSQYELRILSQPKHTLKSDPINKGRYYPATYGGRFDVRFRVYCDAEKARDQRICYADDALAKRIKQILTDRKGYGPSSDLHMIGAILMTCAAWHADDRNDKYDANMPPYPIAKLSDALGPTATRYYNKAIESCRKKEKKDKETKAQQKDGRQSPTSSTHGPQEDTQHTDANHNGTRTTSEKSTKATNKKQEKKAKSPIKISSGIHYLSKPPVKERFWNRSTRVWNPEPISYTAKIRPRSRQRGRTDRSRERSGGRGSYTSASKKKTVFERLSKQTDDWDDDDEMETKKSRITRYKRE